MKHSSAITGILLVHALFFGIPAMAQEVTVDTVDTKSVHWNDCLRLLRLDPDIADRGTYKVRMVKCVNEKIRGEEIGDLDRENRLSLRAQAVRRAFRSGTLGATARSVGIMKATEIEDRRLVPTTLFRRYTTNNVRPASERVSHNRPSRRSIQSGALQQTRETKQTESELYQERWQRAVDACKHIENNFNRSNCIRAQLRQTVR